MPPRLVRTGRLRSDGERASLIGVEAPVRPTLLAALDQVAQRLPRGAHGAGLEVVGFLEQLAEGTFVNTHRLILWLVVVNRGLFRCFGPAPSPG